MSDTFKPDAPEGEPADVVPVVDDKPTAPVAPKAEATPAEPDEPADETGADPEPSKAKGVQKRLDELTALRRQAERERDSWRELAMRQAPPVQQPAQQGQQPMPQLPPDVAAYVGPEPKPEDFPAGEFDPGYLRAAATRDVRVEMAKQAMHQRAAAMQSAEQHFRQDFSAKVAEVAKDNPQAPQAIAALGDRLPDPVANMLAEAGVDIALHVATNPEAEARIREARTPAAVAREIGRIEARLEAAKSTPATPQHSSAPPPPARGVRGGGSATPDHDRMPMAQYAALMAKELTHRG